MLMFSLWVCPDCRAVGRRVAVRSAVAGGKTLDIQKALGPEPARPPKKGAGQTPAGALLSQVQLVNPSGMPTIPRELHQIALSQWQCPYCGQIGELVESRNTQFGEVIEGTWGEIPRRLPIEPERPPDPRIAAMILIGAGVAVGYVWLTALSMVFG